MSMKRRLPLLLTLLSCIPLWLARSSVPSMLADSDTAVLLDAIRKRGSPLSWFGGDWPLGNHFYRPVSTLFFELDNRLYSDQAWGYGLTQVLLSTACVLALYWFVRELVNPWFACLAASLFALWHVDWGDALGFGMPYLACAVLVMAVVRRLAMPVWKGGLETEVKGSWRNLRWEVILGPLALTFLGTELLGHPLRWRIVEWLPGRTASVMTLFALISLAAYARYERLRSPTWRGHPARAGEDFGGGRRQVASGTGLPSPAPGSLGQLPVLWRRRGAGGEVVGMAGNEGGGRQDASGTTAESPYDLPATKSTETYREPPRSNFVWAVLACLALALALGSYEQAVMLPAAILGVAVMFRILGKQPQWGWQVAFWGLLLGYLVLRRSLVPSEVSGYQAQQFRDGPGVWLSLSDYIVPAWRPIQSILVNLDMGTGLLFLPGFYATLIATAANVSALPVLRGSRVGVCALGGFLISIFAFLPMAWLKPFDHYHYWPMAMRSVFVVALGMAAGSWCLRALAPPAMQSR